MQNKNEESMGSLEMCLMSSDSCGEDDGDEIITFPWISADMYAFKSNRLRMEEALKLGGR